MPELTEEEKEILRRAYEIKERILAEELEAGEITVEELYEKHPPVRRQRQKAVNPKLMAAQGAAASEETESDSTQFQRPTQKDEAHPVAPEQIKQVLEQEKQAEKRQAAQKQYQDNEQKLQNRRKRLENERQALQLREQRQQFREQEDREKELRRQKKQQRQHEKNYKQNKKHGGEAAAEQGQKKKKSFWKSVLKYFFCILLVFLLLLGGIFFLVRGLIAKTNYQPYETSYVRQADVLAQEGVTNILLIGTDTRVHGEQTRSDAMIVLSINPGKHRLVMTSILRDSYVNIPGHGQNRINEAYSWGGPALLIQTIEENYKLGIDYYAQVDFFDFVEVVDAFGGVTIPVNFNEVQWINGYVSEYNAIIGAPEGDQFVDLNQFLEPELVTDLNLKLSGRQALGYCRIRKIGTDFARTQRQRTVMNALVARAKTAGPLRIYRAADAMLSSVSTNISDEKMCALLMQSLFYLTYDVVEARVPADGTWSNAIMGSNQDVLAVDFAANKAYLQTTIYE